MIGHEPREPGVARQQRQKPLAERLYGASVADFLRYPLRPALVLAESIAEGDGMACGDRVVVEIARADGRLLVAARVDGSLLCRASAIRLSQTLEGLTLDLATRAIDAELTGLQASRDQEASFAWLGQRVPIDQYASVALPWEAAQSALDELDRKDVRADCRPADSALGLSCDACVTAVRVRWHPQEVPSPHAAAGASRLGRVRAFLAAVVASKPRRHVETPQRIARFGQWIYSPAEDTALESFARSITPRQIAYLVKTHLLGITERHVERLRCRVGLEAEWRLAARRDRLAQRALLRQADLIMDRLRAAGVPFAPVKGLATRRLYDGGPAALLRRFKDLDFMLPDFAALARATQVLLTSEGSSLTMSGSVPFSLKIVEEQDGTELLTGHVHLEMSAGVKVIADLSFPGIPVGRTSVLSYPSLHSDGWPRSEDLTVCTLAHLFKHHVAPIKDFNDLYVLLQTGISEERLRRMLERFGLLFHARLAVSFLVSTYRLDPHLPAVQAILRGERCRERAIIALLLALGWPHEYYPHLAAQLYQQVLRDALRHGFQTS